MTGLRAYLSLGSNLGDRAVHLGNARAHLLRAPRIRLTSLSAVVETAPVDVTDQPDFLNQVAGVETSQSPRDLLETCLSIERALGRDRSSGPPRGPRTIDLDVLLYDGTEVDEEGLRIPHPRLARRPFLLALCCQAGTPPDWLPHPEAAG
ncbi:MAG TPA: 2-amino-4-hydroxy-6-hydroxymethyldihydropteridine diphosphokinase [Gemmatimonadota bacterium]|nr:2-amino-4-hydroxy-6-hydroxymethyldihydropteridine diphosphokinase [Gemmatimonadota bacterium]